MPRPRSSNVNDRPPGLFSVMKEAIPLTTAVTMAKDLKEIKEKEKKSFFTQRLQRLHLTVRALVNRHPKGPKRTFPLFAKLPLEIRLKIWRLATPDPYIHQQVILRDYFSKEALIPWNPDLRRWPNSKCYARARPTPALLHACRESRYEFVYRNFHSALGLGKLQRPLFAPTFEDSTGLLSYFSWEQDIVAVNSHEDLPRRLSGRLRHVAMIRDVAHKYELAETMMVNDFPRWVQHLYVKYPSIETFTLLFFTGPAINAVTEEYVVHCFKTVLARRETEVRNNPVFKCPVIRFAHKDIRKALRLR